MTRYLFILLVCVTVCIPGLDAATRFAHPSGGGGSCTSSGSPCSLTNAIAATQSGDTVIMQAGTYGELRLTPNVAGTSSARTTIRVADGATVIVRNIQAAANGTSQYVTITGQHGTLIIDGQWQYESVNNDFGFQHFTFRDFEMRNSVGNCILVSVVHNVEFLNLRTKGCGKNFATGELLCGEPRETCGAFPPFSGGCIRNRCHGIYLGDHEATNIVVEGGDYAEAEGSGLHMYGTGSGAVIRNVKTHHNDAVGIWPIEGNGYQVYNNLSYDNGTMGIWAGGRGSYLNNTVVNNGNVGFNVPVPITARNNIVFNNTDGPFGDDGGLSSSTLSNNLTSNPGFVSAAGGNFHIAAAGSPAVGSGVNLSSTFTTDLEGAPRPASGAWDLGVYVFATSNAPTFQFTVPVSVPSGTAPTLTWSAVTSQGSGLSCQATVPSGGPDTNWTGTTSQQLIAGGSKSGTAMTAARTYRMSCTDSNGTTNQDRVVAVVPACTRIVYGGGSPWAIPGTIEAEHFDSCSNLAAGTVTGEGTTHHDLEAENQGASYRLFEDVDIENTPGLSNNHNVGFFQAGEWLEYRVSVAKTENYSLAVWASYEGPTPGGTLQLSVDGAPAAATIPIPSTGSWTTYAATSAVVLPLTAGTHTLRLTATANGVEHGVCCNVDRMVFTSAGPPPIADFTGTPLIGPVPLTVTFTDASQGTITSRAWTFGDGGTSTATNPSHTYTSVGSYTVSLTVTGPGGTNPLTRPNYIIVQALPSIGIVAKHPFEEGTSTTAADTSGNPTPHPCTLSSAGWTAGIVGAFGLDANGSRNCSFMSTPDTRPTSPGLSVWVRCFVQLANAYAADMGSAWGLWFDSVTGRPHVYLNTSTGFVTLTGGPNVMNNANHMITWTLDALGVRLWVDALEVGFAPTTGIPTYIGNERFTWASTKDDTEYLTGCTLDHGYLFDRPLNQALVNQLFNDTQSLLGVTQTHRRFYANATEGLPLTPLDTNLSVTLGQLFVLRDAIHYVGSPPITEYFPLWCQRNAGTLMKVSNSFGTLGLRVAQSTFANMGDLTTVPLPSPNGLPLDGFTPVSGRMVVDVIDPTQRTTLASGQHTEWAYFLESGAPAIAGDVFTCQPRRENDTDFTLPYAHLRTVTLQAAPTPGSVFIGGFTGGRLGP